MRLNLSFRNPPVSNGPLSYNFIAALDVPRRLFSAIRLLSPLVSGLERSQFFKRPIKGRNGE